MKTKDEILKEAQDHFGVTVSDNDGGITRRIEHHAMDLWAQEVAKNNVELTKMLIECNRLLTAQMEVKNLSSNLPVIGSVSSSTTVMKEGYYSDNFNTYYIDKDGKKHLR